MLVELYCPDCCCSFHAEAEDLAPESLDRGVAEGLWSDLGDGATFEDSLALELADQPAGWCPDCGAPGKVSEETLGRMAMELLATS